MEHQEVQLKFNIIDQQLTDILMKTLIKEKSISIRKMIGILRQLGRTKLVLRWTTE